MSSEEKEKQQVHYQSITFSDEEPEPEPAENDQPPIDQSAEVEPPPGAEQQDESCPKEGPSNLYSSLKEIDVLCGQVTQDHEALPETTGLTENDDHEPLPETTGLTENDNHEAVPATTELTENNVFLQEDPGDEEKEGALSHSFEETGQFVANEIATYTCKLCSVAFNEQSLVENHLMVEHDLGEQTSLFRVITKVKKKKKNRSWRKEKDGYFHCRFCHHRSRRSINVRDHEQQKHANEDQPTKTYLCKLCNKRFELTEIFSHIQTEHPAEADSSNFIGNSLSEHYTLSFLAERPSTRELPESDVSPNSFNYCQYCSYKSKSLRGLKLHERMQHSNTKSNTKKGLTCMTCGEKRSMNAIHTCNKSKNQGRKRSLLRNSEGHFMCANCPYTAKQYQSLYVHIKGSNHQVARLHPVLPPADALPHGEEIDENNKDGPSRGLRKRKSMGVVVEKDIGNDKVLSMDTDKDKDPSQEPGQGDGENPEGVQNQEGEDWALALEGINDSDTQESVPDDSDNDPEWEPTGSGTPKKVTQAMQMDESDSEEEDENGQPSRKRKLSHEEGSKEKRRRSIDMPKDPKSPAPKKLDNGSFQCNFCDYESKYHQNVVTHQWRHTDFKPYKCDQCQRGFRQRVQLEKHKCYGVMEGENSANTEPLNGPDNQLPLGMSEGPITIEDDTAPSGRADVLDISPAPETEGVSGNSESVQGSQQPSVESANQPGQVPTPSGNGDKVQEETPTEATTTNQGSCSENITDKNSPDKPSPEVTSPVPIVIAPPLDSRPLDTGNEMSQMVNPMMSQNGGRRGNPFNVGNPQVINLDPEQDPAPQVPNPAGCNLVNQNQDMMQMTDPSQHMLPPTPPHSNHGSIRMTSPVGTPLNIAPISSTAAMGPPSQMSMNVMPQLSEGVMPGEYGSGVMNSMAPMGNPMVSTGALMSTGYPNNFQDGGSSGMNHQMNQMSNFVGTVGEPMGTMGQPMGNMGQSMGNMGPPMGNMGQPMDNMGQPMGNMGQPMEPMDNMGQPFDNMGQPMGTIGQPMDAMGQPMGNMGQPMGSMAQPIDTLGQPIPPQFPAPESNLLEHLNLMPNSVTMPSSEANLLQINSDNQMQQFGGTTNAMNQSDSMGSADSYPASQNLSGNFSASQNESNNNVTGPQNTDTSGEIVSSTMTLPTVVEGTVPSGSPTTSQPSSSSGAPPSSEGVGEATGETAAERQPTPEVSRSPLAAESSTTEQSGTTEQTDATEQPSPLPASENVNSESAPATSEPSASSNAPSTTETTASVTVNAVSILESIASAPIPMETEVAASAREDSSDAPYIPAASVALAGTTDIIPRTAPLTLTEVSMSSVVSDLASDDVAVTPQSLVITSVTGSASTTTTPSAAVNNKAVTNDAGKSINDLFKCILCRVYFEDQQMYRSHMLHHGSTIGTCRQCSRMFRTPLLFMNHLHCSANCKGPSANVPVAPYAVSTPRGRGRGRGAQSMRMPQPQTIYPQMATQSVRGRGASLRGQSVNLAGQGMASMTMTMNQGRVGRGTSQVQGMRQIAPTTGRRGRPPLSSRQPTTYTSASMMRQQMPYSAQLQQHHMAVQQQQRVHPPMPRQQAPQGRRQRPAPISEDVIVID